MRYVLRMLQAIGVVGLIAIMTSTAVGQTRSSGAPAGHSAAAVSASGTAMSEAELRKSQELSSRMARRLAGPGAKMLTVDDVVDGGVYFEDPVSGKLILGEAPAKPPGGVPERVPGVASRPGVATSNAPSRAPSAASSRVPSAAPSAASSRVPSAAPSAASSRVPSAAPSRVPTAVPNRVPSATSSASPSRVATRGGEPPVATRVGAIEDVTMDALGFDDAYYDDGCCGDDLCGECTSCMVPCGGFFFPAGNLELFAGVQGFTGPANWSARGGSFGFHQGLNWGMPIPLFSCLGGQVGFRATQSNLSGSDQSDDTRRQAFVTAGLFRRVDVGLQGGVVVDWLSDGWYRDIDLVNLRMEVSWMIDGVHELGYWGTAGTKTARDLAATDLVEWETTDLYAFFYRYNFGACEQGSARLFAGWSGQGDGLIGSELRLPLGTAFALETNFAYLIPNEGRGTGSTAGHAQESWNVGTSLVWYPGRRWGRGDPYYRPLFQVADNGSFMMDRTP